jgi:hypothetical protein
MSSDTSLGSPMAGKGSPTAAVGWPEEERVAVMLGVGIFRIFFLFRDI